MPEAASLRALLAREGCLVQPGVFDGISVRMADNLGFEALSMTGYGALHERAEGQAEQQAAESRA